TVKPIVFISLLVLVAVLGSVINLAWPYIQTNFLNPSWRRKMDEALQYQKTYPTMGGTMKEAVAMADNDKSADPFQVAAVHYQYANAMYEINCIDIAEPQFKIAADGFRKVKNDAWLATTDQMIGWCEVGMWRLDPKYKPSIEEANQSLQLIDKFTAGDTKKRDQYLAVSLRLLATLHGARNENAEAEKIFPRALEMTGKLFPDKYPDTVAEYFLFHLRQGHLNKLPQIATDPPGKEAANIEQTDSEDQLNSLLNKLVRLIGEKDDFRKGNPTRDLQELLHAKKFDELEQIAQKERSAKTERSMGAWGIDAFYDDLSGYNSNRFGYWSTYLPTLDEWMKAKPNTATAAVLKSEYLTDRAWQSRGGGYSNTVSEDGWKGFENDLKEARQVLEKHKAGGACPVWYDEMSTVALGQGWDWDDHVALVEECHKRWPGYSEIDVNTVYYLQPRWYGKSDQWVTWMTKRCNQLKGDQGDKLYARCIMRMEDFYDNIFADFKSLKWARFEHGAQVLIKEFPHKYRPRMHLLALDLKTKHLKEADHVFDGFTQPN
ncbi:MAG TPA: DUF4034 domain-containing protein, partial [Chroococcales cyanobacterium]